jgi:glycosyltransferase involved in cell wall biosynthesis
MKICFDIRALVGQMWFGSGTGSAIAPAGVGVYILRLLDGLTTLDENKEYILFYNSFKKPNLRLIENILQRPNVTLKSFRYPNKVLDRTARFLNWPKIDRLLGGVDVFFSPHINISPLTAQAKHIQVIHDLSFAVYPEFYSWRKRYWNWAQNVKATCARADQIIAVSESTKSDILSLYDVNETKVKVVYPGITEITQVKDFKNYKGKQTDWSLRLTNSLPAEYILYLGTLEPRKNVESILEAYECLNRNIANAPALVIAGGKGWAYKNIFRLAK